MSATTVTKHQPTELRYEGTANGVAVFSSASKSRPGTRNWTYVATDTREVACECQAASGTCWHVDLALTAYAMTQVADFIASKADDELLAIGAAAAEAIAAGRHTATDVAVCWQARAEWLARREAGRAPTRAAIDLYVPRNGCPDCGEPTTEPYLCRACMADLSAARATQPLAA